jgi:hypothetical protein
MKRNRIWLPALALVIAAAAGWWIWRRAEGSEAPAYRFAAIRRGSLEASVSATGNR